MSLERIIKKVKLSKVGSIVLAIALIVNLCAGYVAYQSTQTREVKAAANPQYRNVMYYGQWSIYPGQHNYYPSYIDGSKITHLNFAFMDVDENGNVISTDSYADFENNQIGFPATYGSIWAGVVAAMVQLREKYPNMKIGFSVGGWTRSGDFPKVASTDAKRKAFARNIAKLAHLYGYDFVDIDWEYPTADRDPDPAGNGVTVDKGCKGSANDTRNFTLLLQELRSALDEYDAIDNKHYELSVAMSASPAMMEKIEYDKVLQTVDFANMMTYDLNGAWNAYTGHQTALFTNDKYNKETQKDGQFSVNACVDYLYKKYGNSIDPSKIVVGVAPYTRGWAEVKNDGPDPQNPGLYATATPNSVKAADGTTSGTFAFSDIDQLSQQYGLKEYYDETAQAAYYYNPSTGYFFTCDNERSVAAKGEYVKNGQFKNPFNKPLGGLISWMASLDAGNSITNASYKALYGSSTLPEQTISYPTIDNIETTIQASGNDYIITIKNNNKITTPEKQGTFHGGAEVNALYYGEKYAGTISYPKYYIKTSDNEILTGASWSAGGTISSDNGYTVITDTNHPYMLEPGGTKTITLTSSKPADVSKITEVSVSKRVSDSSAEMGRTVVYGDKNTPVVTTKAQTTTQNQVTTKAQATTQAQATTKAQATTQAQTTTKVHTGSTYPLWDPNGVSYKVGDKVVYQGKVYECTFAHNSQADWTPTAVAALWRDTGETGAVVETTAKAGGETGNNETPTENNYTVNGKLPQHMVTGYWHNFANGSTNLALAEVPEYYDMICVAFTGNTTTPGEATFEISDDLKKDERLKYSDEKFIEDVKTVKNRGQHVIISVGGAEGRIDINSEAAANRFAQSMSAIIKKYGFEGIDIDLEGAAVSGTTYIASALRQLHNEFGDDFIITMAPETYYMTPGGAGITSAYWNLAMSIKDILTTVHTQFYNSGSMIGYNGSIVNQGTPDFAASLSTLYIESGLRPDQVAIGLPSNAPAGSGALSPENAALAYNAMINGTNAGNFKVPKAYPTFRGLMTWSINWDAKQDYAWAKAAKAAVSNSPVIETSSKVQTTTKQQPTTQQPTTQKQTTQQATTQQVTTQKATTDNSTITVSDDVKVKGFQISTTLNGSRVIGQVKNTINGKKVSKWGFVYAVTNINGNAISVSESDMYVGTKNKFAASFESTSAGTMTVSNGDANSTYFVRTTLFAPGNSIELAANYKVRAYAQLSDGSIVYSTVKNYSIYSIADNLYQNSSMATENAHNYLLNNILKVVNPSYASVKYNWSNSVVLP